MRAVYYGAGPDLGNGLAGRGLMVPGLQPHAAAIHSISPAPCTQKCPAGVEVKAYVSLIAEERFAEALEVIRRRCPLPSPARPRTPAGRRRARRSRPYP